MGFLKNLTEELNKSFYSEREAKETSNQVKNWSTSTPETVIQEDGIIVSDISAATSGMIIETVIAERNALIDAWRNMAETPEVDEAIIEISNEAFVFDESGDMPFELDLEDIEIPENLKKKILEAHDKILKLIKFNQKGTAHFKQWYTDGSIQYEVIYNNKKLDTGIKKLRLLPPYNFYKVRDPTDHTERFFFDTRRPDKINTWGSSINLQQLYQDAVIQYKPEQIAYVDSGKYSKDRLFPISHLNKALKPVNDLVMIEEALLIYRFTRAPQRNQYIVKTGRLPKPKAEQYLTSMQNKHRNKATYNTTTGRVENRKRSIPMQEDYWFAEDDQGRGTTLTSLDSASVDINGLDDLTNQYRKLWRALNVPVNRRDPDSRAAAINMQNTETENEEIKFYKFVLDLRKKYMYLFVDLLKKELISTKIFALDDWKEIEEYIKFKFKNNNDFAESKKLVNLEGKIGLAQSALGLVGEEGGNIIDAQWIRENIMNFTEEETKELDKRKEQEPAPEGAEIEREDSF